MREVNMANNPRVVVYSCLDGMKCEIRNTNQPASNKEQLLSRSEYYVLKFDKLSTQAYKLLKNSLSSVHNTYSTPLFDHSNRLLYTTGKQLEEFATRNATQMDSLVGKIVENTIDNFKRESFEVSYPKGKLILGSKTHVMGILNITPDSFYDGKRYHTVKDAINHALKMAEDGADIVDVGGESTRPGAYPVSEGEEIKRVIPVVKILAKEIQKPISIDTWKAKVAEKAINAGASIINDIGGLIADKNMAKVAADAKVPIIIMHKKGTPRTMQKYPIRKNLLPEIISYLTKSVSIALNAGIDKNKIILDPGIGFGKTLRHNLEILKRLREFKSMGFPILIGTSRKKFIGTILKLPVHERLYGTLATLAIAVMNGAHIVRVHDVREAVQVVTVCDAIRNI